MDDIQCPASLPRRHRVAFDDRLHTDDEIRVATIQQIDPLMTQRIMPEPHPTPLFNCPNCNALYHVVKADLRSEMLIVGSPAVLAVGRSLPAKGNSS